MITLLLACSGEPDKDGAIPIDTAADDSGDTGSVKPPDIVLGHPYVVVVAATTPGSLDSTCELDLVLTNKSDGTVAATLEMNAQGRDWAGTELVGGTLYTANFSAIDCNAADDKSYESGSFSGQEGILFVLWYTGVNVGYDALEQGTEGGDFKGGEASVTVANSTPDANVQALATELGITATLQTADASGNVYALTWSTDLNVGEVLSEFTKRLDDAYVSGTPTWLTEPDWW